MKAWSLDMFMKVTSAKVSDEDGFLSNSMMIKAKNTIMMECIIDRIVDVTVAMQREVPTIQTVLQTLENLQVQFPDRVVDMPILMQQETSPARLCFCLASKQWRSVTRRACDCSLKRNVICILSSTRWTSWELLVDVESKSLLEVVKVAQKLENTVFASEAVLPIFDVDTATAVV